MTDKTTSQSKDSETSTHAQPKPTFARVPDFFELYANNVAFESSVWDLTITFGLLDQTPDAPPFKQFGSIRIPWRQAKLIAYFLAMNVAYHEASNGAITIPPGVTPPNIEAWAQEHFPNDPQMLATVERINRIRAELGLAID